MHTIRTPKFSAPKENFAQELRTRVYGYFQTNNISKFGGKKLVIKAALLIIFFGINYLLWIISGFDLWIKILLSISLGIITSLIGFNVMHDGAHQSFSKNKTLNELAGYTLNFLGANVFFWKTKHNIVHHTYTNIPGADDDIEAGIFLYLNPTKKHYWFHRFQHIYFLFIYALLYLYWIFYADYKKYFSEKVALTPIANFSKREKIIFWVSKVFHLVIFVVLPVLLLGFQEWLIMFLIYAFTTGIVLSMVFQLAHIVEETNFPVPNAENQIEDAWMIHQLKTTANFAMNSKLLSYLLGGLNYQIEHHLFPAISHIHYPQISRIVQEVCYQFNVPYYAHPTLARAVHSHYRRLKQLGRGNEYRFVE